MILFERDLIEKNAILPFTIS